MIRLPFDTLARALQAHAARAPEQLVFRRKGFRNKPDEMLTFSDLHQGAQRIAAALDAEGTVEGDRVVLAYPTGNDFILAFLGCLLARRIPVPVNLGKDARSAGRIRTVAQDCDAALLLCPDPAAPAVASAQLPGGCRPLAHDRLAGGVYTPRPIDPDDIAFLQYTSGSTGDPKGVIVTHRSLATNLHQIASVVPADLTRIVSWLPQFHDMGLIGTVLTPIYAGWECTYFSPMEFVQRPMRWLQVITETRAHGAVAPNFGFSYVLERMKEGEAEGLDLSSLGILMSGSEPISVSVMDRFLSTFAPTGLRASALAPSYGLAEATLLVSALRPGLEPSVQDVSLAGLERDQVVAPGSDRDRRRVMGCGQLADDMTLQIAAPAPGGVGEIVIDGPNVSPGYWGRRPRKAGFATGDLGFVMDGQVYITGRIKDLIVIRGRNLYPTDIEAISQAATPGAGANSAAAIGLTGAEARESFVVVQELSASQLGQADPDALRRAIAQSICDEIDLLPDTVILVRSNALPRTTSGKVARSAARQALLDHSLRDHFNPTLFEKGPCLA
ncbi:fatty acyl-AMP ligase [Actibacterium sp. XHP0104]|uniref:fatty acyl-AMP ligase n=1 Tax=Actibacterium sp. XHP0104 TaxID=2984335 RepID=UPI0021E6E972|nr:fatty acyl-AMP ligase [Actibacterium sp. XHP0104]MCV2881303.1 fatty acyl-AMP ligase [Actibacterium sp. XHP0104]